MRIFLMQALVFLASFLIFQIELILGKWILPGFGGGYLVWGITVVFYQCVLFLGYAYVHLLNGRLPFSRLRKTHSALVILSLLLLPVNAERLANPAYRLPVVMEIILMLLLTIGVLFFILSTLSVYLQVHLAASNLEARHNPYVLYAGSNLGAFASLLTYPFFWEPNFDLPVQLMQWQAGYLLVVILFGAIQLLVPVPGEEKPLGHPIQSVEPPVLLKWLLLSAAPSALFLAITNEITFNIPPVPLLWILPLSIYLLTLVLCFKQRPFCPRFLLDRASLWIALGTLFFLFKFNHHTLLETFLLTLGGTAPGLYLAGVLAEPVLLLILCFVLCLVCHYRLQEEKPKEPGRLTSFYLILSAGGFAGGFLVNWVAPLVFNVTLETLISFLLAAWGLALGKEGPEKHPRRLALLLAVILAANWAWPNVEQVLPRSYSLLVSLGGAAVLFLLMFGLGSSLRRYAWMLAGLVLVVPFLDHFVLQQRLVYKARDYYGLYTVLEEEGFRKMKHGTIMHGAQYLDPERKLTPTSYYHPGSPMGQLLTQHLLPMDRVAVVGLGAGSLALFTRPGETWDYFEIDPEVGYIARRFFPFLSSSPAKINLIFGDARVSLRHQPSGKYDALMVDVFNSGAIPVHLLTLEALQEYRRVLKPDGVIFFNISNQFLNLIPVVYTAAQQLNLFFSMRFSAESKPPEKEPTLWLAVTSSEPTNRILRERLGWRAAKSKTLRPWTDRYSSLWPVFMR